MRRPLSNTTRLSASAASTTRQSTTVSGGSSPTAILEKKNDPPHNSASVRSRAHSTEPMTCLAAVLVLTIADNPRCLHLPSPTLTWMQTRGMPNRALEMR
jgi:hypothetical protein